MGISRRSVIKGIGATAAVAAINPMSSRRSLAAAGKPIVYWGHNYPSRVQIVNDIMVPGFKTATGLDVVHEFFETNQNELKILTGWAGGTGGPDLVSVGDSNLPNYVYRKLIAPVDPAAFGYKTQKELIDAFDPGVLDSFIVDGKLYAIPMDAASISMYYRKDFFKEAGLDSDKPPRTWEEVIEMGKVLTKTDGGKVVRAGWAWLSRTLPSHFYYWGTLLPQKGTDFITPDATKNAVMNDAGMEAFQYLYDTFHGPNRVTALGLAPTISPIDDFGAGRAAMINAGLWLAPSLEAKYPSVTYKDGVYGTARLPQFAKGVKATRLNTWVWMVSSHSEVQREAWQFVSFMTQKAENRAIWLKRANFIQPWKGFSNDPDIKAIPFVDAFLEDLKIGVPMPRTYKFAELASLVAKSYDRISANAERPEVVVPDLGKAIDRMIEF